VPVDRQVADVAAGEEQRGHHGRRPGFSATRVDPATETGGVIKRVRAAG